MVRVPLGTSLQPEIHKYPSRFEPIERIGDGYMNHAEGLRIICADDCGNSPKKAFLKEFNVAFVEGNQPFIMENLADDIQWTIVGDKRIEGKKAFIAKLSEMQNSNITELHLKTIITHGKTGAVDGTIKLDSGKVFAFCDMYLFTSAGKKGKLKEITSYVIEIKD